MKAQRCAQRGFTLVEMVMVAGILLTITAMAAPSFLSALNNARYARAVGDIYALQTDVLSYSSSNGKLPRTLGDVGRAAVRDPWGMPYIYKNPQVRKDHFRHPLNSDFDLFSSGPDKQWRPQITNKASLDDVVRASDGGYVGKASEY
jgi:general secretion pathway protein G